MLDSTLEKLARGGAWIRVLRSLERDGLLYSDNTDATTSAYYQRHEDVGPITPRAPRRRMYGLYE